MNFLCLKEFSEKWDDILVIGRDVERDGKKYHFLGMALFNDEVTLYIIEPFFEEEVPHLRGPKNQRRILKEHCDIETCYMNCKEFIFGQKKYYVRSGQAGPLKYAKTDCQTIKVFINMLQAGWSIPKWLEETEWENLQLVTLTMKDVKRLPKYSEDMPITVMHEKTYERHFVEKSLTLEAGKKRTISFNTKDGEKVYCYINKVYLIDVWKDTEEQFNNPDYIKKVTKEQLAVAKEFTYKALEESCPKGMCYVGIEYECSKDISLKFDTKEFLKSAPYISKGSAHMLLMRIKPDEEIGEHGFSQHGCVMQTPLPADTIKIPSELVYYMEASPEWKEKI